MSDIIKLLPDHIANQIAAGEVIPRPASVVKEMVENAIDAGATKIQVIIKDAGKTLIQIIDNGKGMSEKDAVMCFERHATSKVSKAEDLFSLTTKGFRGEALASIAAIAHVTLSTRQEAHEIGTSVEIEGSKIKSCQPFVCSVGTSFEVKNLFYNVPARRSFLKSDNVEFNHIVNEFERIVLAHPEISFSLHHNNQEVYNLHSAILRKRIVDVLGRNSNDKLVPIEESTDIVEIIGYVGKPEFSKKSRGEQFLFVNNRFFKDSFFNHSLTKAFDGLIQPKMFPTFFLYLTVDPKKIDVNVHPTKTEIKFEEDRLIYSILLSSVRQALGKYNIAPTLDFNRETSFDIPYEMNSQNAVEPSVKVNKDFNPFQTTSASRSTSSISGSNFTKAIKNEGFGSNETTPQDWQNFYKIDEVQETEEKLELELDVEQNVSKSLLIKGKYLLAPCKSGVLIIDCQRAFERIFYDELMNQFISKPINSQKLLFPLEREFSSNEKKEWLNNNTMLERLGLFAEFHENTMLLSAMPSVLQEESIHECIDLIIENIAFKAIDKGEIAHVIATSIAAAAGRKKSNLQNNESAEMLIERLFQCPEHSFTPKGKKIIQTLTLEEIASKF